MHRIDNRSLMFLAGCLAAISPTLAGEARVLKRSDVVFMYQSDRQTYADYGATVLAWAPGPNRGINCRWMAQISLRKLIPF